jgi:hypothetical protein
MSKKLLVGLVGLFALVGVFFFGTAHAATIDDPNVTLGLTAARDVITAGDQLRVSIQIPRGSGLTEFLATSGCNAEGFYGSTITGGCFAWITHGGVNSGTFVSDAYVNPSGGITLDPIAQNWGSSLTVSTSRTTTPGTYTLTVGYQAGRWPGPGLPPIEKDVREGSLSFTFTVLPATDSLTTSPSSASVISGESVYVDVLDFGTSVVDKMTIPYYNILPGSSGGEADIAYSRKEFVAGQGRIRINTQTYNNATNFSQRHVPFEFLYGRKTAKFDLYITCPWCTSFVGGGAKSAKIGEQVTYSVIPQQTGWNGFLRADSVTVYENSDPNNRGADVTNLKVRADGMSPGTGANSPATFRVTPLAGAQVGHTYGVSIKTFAGGFNYAAGYSESWGTLKILASAAQPILTIVGADSVSGTAGQNFTSNFHTTLTGDIVGNVTWSANPTAESRQKGIDAKVTPTTALGPPGVAMLTITPPSSVNATTTGNVTISASAQSVSRGTITTTKTISVTVTPLQQQISVNPSEINLTVQKPAAGATKTATADFQITNGSAVSSVMSQAWTLVSNTLPQGITLAKLPQFSFSGGSATGGSVAFTVSSAAQLGSSSYTVHLRNQIGVSLASVKININVVAAPVPPASTLSAPASIPTTPATQTYEVTMDTNPNDPGKTVTWTSVTGTNGISASFDLARTQFVTDANGNAKATIRVINSPATPGLITVRASVNAAGYTQQSANTSVIPPANLSAATMDASPASFQITRPATGTESRSTLVTVRNLKTGFSCSSLQVSQLPTKNPRSSGSGNVYSGWTPSYPYFTGSAGGPCVAVISWAATPSTALGGYTYDFTVQGARGQDDVIRQLTGTVTLSVSAPIGGIDFNQAVSLDKENVTRPATGTASVIATAMLSSNPPAREPIPAVITSVTKVSGPAGGPSQSAVNPNSDLLSIEPVRRVTWTVSPQTELGSYTYVIASVGEGVLKENSVTFNVVSSAPVISPSPSPTPTPTPVPLVQDGCNCSFGTTVRFRNGSVGLSWTCSDIDETDRVEVVRSWNGSVFSSQTGGGTWNSGGVDSAAATPPTNTQSVQYELVCNQDIVEGRVSPVQEASRIIGVFGASVIEQ